MLFQYAFCNHNPVMHIGNSREFWDTVFDVVSLHVSVIDVVKSPYDPGAEVSLAADKVRPKPNL